MERDPSALCESLVRDWLVAMKPSSLVQAPLLPRLSRVPPLPLVALTTRLSLVALSVLVSLSALPTATHAQEAPPLASEMQTPTNEPGTDPETSSDVASLLAARERWSGQRVSLAGPSTLIVAGAVGLVLGGSLFRQYDVYDCDPGSCSPTRAFPEVSKALLITGALSIAAGATWLPFRRKKRHAQREALDRIDAQLREARPQLSDLPLLVPRTAAQPDFIGLAALVQL